MIEGKNEEETAKQLYLYAFNTFKEIGKLLGRDEETISRWAKKGKWAEQKKEIETIGDMRLQITLNLYRKAYEKSQSNFNFDEMNKAAAAINAFSPKRPDFDNAMKFAQEFLLYCAANLPQTTENTLFIETYTQRVGNFLKEYEK